jgi:hypothetical protein
VGLAAVSVAERRTQRAIDQTGRQDGPLRGTALAAEERAGDLAHGIHALLDVDGEGEEIDSLPYLAVGDCGGEHLGVTDLGDHGAVGLKGQLPRGEYELDGTDGAA